MSTTTITGLPDATTPLTGNERVPMDQAGTTKDATTQDIADLAGEAITAAIDTHDDEADPHNGASPTFADLTLTGLLTAPHIHGTLAGDVYVHVKNTSGGTLAANTAVYVTGSVGDTDRVEVAACDPTDPAKMPAIGLLKTALANNAEGDAVILGELRPTDTSSYTLGDELYVGAGGALVNTIPASGTVQHVGSVARVQAETGTIVVGIGAGMARVGFTGAYSDLSGTPSIPAAADATPQPLGAAAIGVSDDYAREDHVHAMPSAADVGADPVGTASSAISTHEAAADPHPGYALESSLGGAALLNVGTTAGTVAAGDDSRFTTDLTYTASTRVLASSTGADATLPLFTSTEAGLTPLSGGGTTNFLRADGTWAAPPAGGGTVTSVGLAAPTGFSVSGSPVTTSGNITLSFAAGYSLPTTASQTNWDTAYSERLYWDGGATGLDAATGRTSLGLASVASTGAYSDLSGTPTLGTAAALDVGTTTGTVAAGDDARFAVEDIYIIACSDETTDLATGTAKVTFRMPTSGTLTAVKATATTAPVGSDLIVDINEAGTSVLSTKLSIDDGEKTSETAATPPVISDSALADDAEITIDIDQVGSGTAGAGLKVTLYVSRS